MVKFKTFDLPGGGHLRVRADSIIATIHSNKETIDIYCIDKEIPFHALAKNDKAQEIVDYIWDD